MIRWALRHSKMKKYKILNFPDLERINNIVLRTFQSCLNSFSLASHLKIEGLIADTFQCSVFNVRLPTTADLTQQLQLSTYTHTHCPWHTLFCCTSSFSREHSRSTLLFKQLKIYMLSETVDDCLLQIFTYPNSIS